MAHSQYGLSKTISLPSRSVRQYSMSTTIYAYPYEQNDLQRSEAAMNDGEGVPSRRRYVCWSMVDFTGTSRTGRRWYTGVLQRECRK